MLVNHENIACTMCNINIYSLNANCLASLVRRRAVFEELKIHRSGIFVSLENHSAKETEAIWKSQ